MHKDDDAKMNRFKSDPSRHNSKVIWILLIEKFDLGSK